MKIKAEAEFGRGSGRRLTPLGESGKPRNGQRNVPGRHGQTTSQQRAPRVLQRGRPLCSRGRRQINDRSRGNHLLVCLLIHVAAS